MIQIYTGEGKGKTTAAVGLAVRAAGAGLKVLFVQVIKDGTSSEIGILETIPKISVKIFGTGEWLTASSDDRNQKQKVRDAISFARENINNFQVVVIDELVTAVHLGLVPEEQIIELLKSVPKEVEIVITGHDATGKLIKVADLVSEIRPVKHYFKEGTRARKGIEL